MSSLSGRLLVAAPILEDDNFRMTVVLVLGHDDDDGALGVVVNRPSDLPVADAVERWAPLASTPAVVHAGGPVGPETALGLARPSRGVHPSEQVDIVAGAVVVDLAEPPEAAGVPIDEVKVFAGYAGWSPGQLEDEIAEGAWFVVDAEQGDLFDAEPGELWRRVMARQPGPLAQLRHYPDDPSLN